MLAVDAPSCPAPVPSVAMDMGAASIGRRNVAVGNRGIRAFALDGLVAAVVALIQVGGAAADASRTGEPRLTIGAVTWLLVSALPLAWRRLNPVAVLAVVGLVTSIYGARAYPDPLLQLPLLVAFYTVAARCSRRTTVLLAITGALIGLGAMLMSGDSGPDDYYGIYLTVLFALLVGDRQRIRADHLEALEDRSRELRRRLAAEAEQAAGEERQRIAREMHDVVAHHVSLVVVQAEAAAATSENPERFDAIAATARSAMQELRRVLGVLRDDTDGVAAPQPGLDRLDALVNDVRRAGLAVELRIEGERSAVPAGVDLSAYRIVQEALTNVARHAQGARVHAEVTVRYSPSTIELRVVDDGFDVHVETGGRRVEPGHHPGGRGLIGLRERVAMCGGAMTAGLRPSGGYELWASLPVNGAGVVSLTAPGSNGERPNT